MEGHHRKDEGRAEASILVVGTGAIGGFYGARLAQAGARVSVVARSDHDRIRAGGIHVQSEGGDVHFEPRQVLRSARECDGPPDIVLVATKVIPGADTADLVQGAVGPGTSILLIQNGIDIEEPVSRAFPETEILSGLAFIAANRVGPGRILHLDYGRLTLGRYPSGPSRKAEMICSLLESVGVPCLVTEDVVTARWQKLVWNAPFNPISVLAGGVDTQAILGSEELTRVARAVMEEVCRLAAAVQHPLSSDVIDQNIDGTRAMKPYKTSMLLDYENGRPMEVEAILGNAVRLARSNGVPAPHLETLYALLHLVNLKGDIERHHRSMGRQD
ncbi:MAG: 2-dehydropantoate 2-reductase [Syntrophobacteraceae bacterium]|jgi:2-dehydropantoate 2-reductase|nr:2-dehydropantoate 2-reductase [Syntrophobacteraceae bacterium]